jgi:predicted DNA-binding transcriptional regulator YafY
VRLLEQEDPTRADTVAAGVRPAGTIDLMASARTILLVLARARRVARRVRIAYRDAGGAMTDRDVDVFGVAFQDGCWYAFVHCHLRRAVRLFRVDRILDARPVARAARARPPRGFDPGFFASVEYLEPGAPVAHLASIRLERPLSAAASALFPSAIAERDGDAVVCHVRASRPAALAALVASLGEGASFLSCAGGDGGGAARSPSRS